MTLSPAQIARSRPRIPVLYEVLGVVGAYFAYFAVRGATESEFDRALGHAELIRRFEQGLGLFQEPRLQAAILDKQWVVDLANWVYVWGHWPIIAGVAVWLYRSHRERYRLLRNAMLISGGIGLVIFTTFPVAPPRLADMGLVDTVVQNSDLYRVLQPPALTNQYAAVPSLHFGWNLLIGIAIFRESSRLSGRIVGVLSPLAMFAAVVLTGNHYIIDTVVGGTVALIGLRAAYAIRDADSRERRVLRAAREQVAAVVGRSDALPVPAALLPSEVAPPIGERSGVLAGATEPSPVRSRASYGCAPGTPCAPAHRSWSDGRAIADDVAPRFAGAGVLGARKVSEQDSVARSRAIQDRDALDVLRVGEHVDRLDLDEVETAVDEDAQVTR